MSKGNQKRTGLPVIHESAAGIDIGSRFHVVAVPPGLADQPVQSFQAFTADWHHHRGDGVDGRLLGTGVRDIRRAWH